MSSCAESGSGFSGCVVVAGSSQEDRAEVVALFFVGFVVRFEGAPEAEKMVWCDKGGRVVLGLGDRGEPSQQGDYLGSGQAEDVDAAEPDGVLAAGGSAQFDCFELAARAVNADHQAAWPEDEPAQLV